jgi:hypothetical protein
VLQQVSPYFIGHLKCMAYIAKVGGNDQQQKQGDRQAYTHGECFHGAVRTLFILEQEYQGGKQTAYDDQ